MLKAIIFDFDGVITDSEPVHLKMFQKVLREKGISLSIEEYHEKYLGMDDKGCFTTLLQSHGIEVTPSLIQSLVKKKTTYLMEYIKTVLALSDAVSRSPDPELDSAEGEAKNNLFIYPGVADFIEMARDRYPLAIASGALRHEIEFVLRRSGILPAFKVIVSAEDVREGKPDPECFIKALKRLNEIGEYDIKAGECLVIEDSIAGIEAARTAGMKCIAVTNTYGHEKLTMADMVIKSLKDMSVEDLESVIKRSYNKKGEKG